MEQHRTTREQRHCACSLKISAVIMRFRSQSSFETIVGGMLPLEKNSTPMSRHGVRANSTTVRSLVFLPRFFLLEPHGRPSPVLSGGDAAGPRRERGAGSLRCNANVMTMWIFRNRYCGTFLAGRLGRSSGQPKRSFFCLLARHINSLVSARKSSKSIGLQITMRV